MSEVKPIPAEEYAAVIEAAKWVSSELSTMSAHQKRMARVLLALAGAWEDAHEFLPAAVSHLKSPSGKNAADLIDNHLKIIAEGRLLPVPVEVETKPCQTCGNMDFTPKGFDPCPECGGSKVVDVGWDERDMRTGEIRPVKLPCPTCHGEGR